MTEQSVTHTTRRVSLSEITTRTDVFQFRHVEVDRRHVNALVKALENTGPLDPLALWADPDSGALVVVDGHHRFAAYKQVGWAKTVPAVIYTCGVREARLLALRENSKSRLQFTDQERADAAWRLVCLNCYSKRQEVKESGISAATVGRMRRTREALLKLDPDCELPSSWWKAGAKLRGAEGRAYTDEERDDMIAAKTEKLDEQIGKQLGFMAANQIEAAAAVVADRMGRQGLRYLFDMYADAVDDFDADYFPFGDPDEDNSTADAAF